MEQMPTCIYRSPMWTHAVSASTVILDILPVNIMEHPHPVVQHQELVQQEQTVSVKVDNGSAIPAPTKPAQNTATVQDHVIPAQLLHVTEQTRAPTWIVTDTTMNASLLIRIHVR